ncbi:hypothetical protein L0F63_006263 [Massospora cicadina]|nr:hypothetical protein L0F63_006263 [Massospora cicadina]
MAAHHHPQARAAGVDCIDITKITRHSISLFTQLPEARKEAEVLLAAFVETLSRHYLDAEVENSYYADLSPHYADAPTPWLSALIWYCNQHPLIEAGLSENQPPDPSSPSAMVG